MSFHRWLQNLSSALTRNATKNVSSQPLGAKRRHGQRSALGAALPRLHLEPLEDRRLLALLAPVDYAAGSSPQAIVSADFNNDHVLDLAVANYSSSSVSVLLGNVNGEGQADGTFQPAVDSATGVNPLSLAVGDFNDDGKMDLATANNYDVSVLLGDGDGSFGAPSSIGVDGNPASVAVGDFNSDGLLDLGVASNVYIPGFEYCYWGIYCYWYPGYYEGRATVLLGHADSAGKADGTFTALSASYLGYGYHTSAVVGDFLGDGGLDFAAVGFDQWTVSVMEGDGQGNLFGPYAYSVGAYPWSMAADDVDGDGRADLAAANRYGNDVSVLLGADGGGFSAAHNYGTGSEPTSVVLGDFNHDTHLDIATANRSDDTLSVLPGRGDGSFGPALSFAAGSDPSAVSAGDFDGDGWLDAATANYSGNASVLLNDHSWPAVPPPPPPPPSFSIKDVSVSEGDSGTVEATFEVKRIVNLAGEVTVNYSTANDGALAGSDYVAKSGALTFADGVDSMLVTILVNGDLTDELDQGFFVNLSAVPGVVIADGQGFGTILDNDAPPTISITPKVSGKEGRNNTTTSLGFLVTLSAPSEKEVRVNFATANDTATTADNDYTAKSGTLIFAPGTTTQTVSVVVRGDKRKEGSQTFFVNLSGSSNATIAMGQGIGEILEDDGPPKGKL